MILKFLGGVRTVTGSCFYIECNKLKILIESGIYQGEGADEVNRAAFDFHPEEINYIFITHAHLDHSGMLPRIVKEGFRGKIITTSATRDLLEPMLYDSAHIQESDAAWSTRKAIRAGKPAFTPLYTVDDVKAVIPLCDVKPYEKIFHLGNGIKYRFLDAGHILGSGTLELWYQDSEKEKKIVFSGDIGKKGNPIIRDPLTPAEADFVVREKRLYNIHVYLDSPLAEEATKVYLAHPECFDEEAMKFFSTKGFNSSI